MTGITRATTALAILVAGASGMRAAEPPSVGRLKQLISRAASITPEQLERMVSAPAAPKFHEWPTQPLTLVLMTPVRTGPSDDLRIPSDAPPTPAKLIRVLAPWLPGGRAGAKRDYASVIRPEYAHECAVIRHYRAVIDARRPRDRIAADDRVVRPAPHHIDTPGW